MKIGHPESLSTDVRPCTSVEDKFCKTKLAGVYTPSIHGRIGKGIAFVKQHCCIKMPPSLAVRGGYRDGNADTCTAVGQNGRGYDGNG